MSGAGINLELAEIALDRAGGDVFEKFVNAFYPAIAGENFVPMGGMRDGGVDAFEDERITIGERTKAFYQSSVQKAVQTKIRATIKRLRESGRDPRTLVYVTSQKVPNLDLEEQELSHELKVMVRIRDRVFIASHINDTVGTRAAFDTYLKPLLSFLRRVGAPELLPASDIVSSPAIYVFLRQELDRSDKKLGLVNALADGLILWALEGTDPDQGKFMTAKQITQKIEMEVPAAAKVLKGAIPIRLNTLASRGKSQERPIRWHRKQDQYCLAYEFRSRLEQDNATDEALRIKVLDLFKTRISGDNLNISPELAAETAEVSLRAVQKTFEVEGLQFAAFLTGALKESILPTISDHVDGCLGETKIPTSDKPTVKIAIINNLQSAFYHSHEAERLLFSRLSATFTLLFCLKTEPRVVEYFQHMAGDFYLYVGSDLLVRTLTERYLLPQDQSTRNALKLMRQLGATLVLAEPVLDEVHTHIAATDYEFYNKYRLLEPDAKSEYIFRNSDRILIRAYFYARHTPPDGIQGPRSWNEYIEQFCDARRLHEPSGREQLRNYLTSEFGLTHESRENIETLTNEAEVKSLADRLLEYKDVAAKARNDALLALAVYGRRKQRRENSGPNPYGCRTWWLTGESRILDYTRELIKARGSHFIMRPDFIVRFVAIAPSAAEIRHSYATIFPSLLGIRLARRVPPGRTCQSARKGSRGQSYGRRQKDCEDLGPVGSTQDKIL